MIHIRRIPFYMGIAGTLYYVAKRMELIPKLVLFYDWQNAVPSEQAPILGLLLAVVLLLISVAAYIVWKFLRRLGGLYDKLVMAPVFYGYFGAWPERGKRKHIVQVIVDRKLSVLARELDAAFKEEYKILATYSNDPFPALAEHRKAETAVAIEKRRFWLGHGAAKLFGLRVYDSYKDYLEKKELPSPPIKGTC